MFLEKVLRGNNSWALYAVTLFIVFLATQLGSLPLVAYAMFLGGTMNFSPDMLTAVYQSNAGLALMLLPFAFGLAALLLCVKYIHGKKCMDIVTGRQDFDYRRFIMGFGVWLAISIITFIIGYFTGGQETLEFQFNPWQFIPLFFVILLIMPFQTSFEELLFRGYLTQWTGYLFNNRLVAWILPSLLFALLHGANPEVDAFGFWIAMPQYIIMGLLLGFITLADDGTELALGLHFANNSFAALTVTSGASAIQTHALFREMNPTSSITDSIYMLIAALLFIFIINRKYRILHNLSFSQKIR
ncbi:MAG: lysostaphin resistance A-like protein [Marinifilaceae bacterium]